MNLVPKMPKIKSIILLLILSSGVLTTARAATSERIEYKVKPLGGRAEYTDLGLVDLEGKKVNKSIFHTHVFGFDDVETIYTLEQDSLPVRVERDIRRLIGRERIIEEYDPVNFTVTITKYKGKKKLRSRVFKAEGPIHNAVLLMFYARRVSGLAPGWHKTFWVPKKFEVTLTSIDKIKIRDKTYTAYHFNSRPDKFELWIDTQGSRIPLRINGRGGFKYSLILDEY